MSFQPAAARCVFHKRKPAKVNPAAVTDAAVKLALFRPKSDDEDGLFGVFCVGRFAVYMWGGDPSLTERLTCDWQSGCLCSGRALKTDTPGASRAQQRCYWGTAGLCLAATICSGYQVKHRTRFLAR